jgi:Cysteine-rich secretory protein family
MPMWEGVRRSRLAIPLLLLAGLVPAADAGARSCGKAATEVPTASTVGAARKATLCLVNNARERRGLRALRGDTRLGAAAQGHAKAMTSRLFFAPARPSQAMAWNVDYLAAPKFAVRRMLGRGADRAKLLRRGARRAGIGVSPSTPVSPDQRGATYVVEVG